MKLLKDRYFQLFVACYMLAVGTLAMTGVYSLAEPLFMLVIFGLLLPGLAYALSSRCASVPIRVEASKAELLLTAALVLFVTVYLIWGSDWVDGTIYAFAEASPSFDFFLNLIKKVMVFVLIPYLLLSRLFGYRWRDFGFQPLNRKLFGPPELRLLAVFFVVYLAIQLFIGQAAQPVFRGEFSLFAMLVGGLLTYAVAIIEVGLVEEFFFRALLQTRLAAWLKSETAGLFLMALIFGLAHAPGLYLREAGAVTALGSEPDLASVLAYAVAVLSLAGLAFGVIWARTRNIYVLILIHAWVDTLPSLPEFIAVFGLN